MTSKKILKTERLIELIIWPILAIIIFTISKFDILPNSTLAFAGLFLASTFLLYYLTYALIPPAKQYFKNYTDPILLSLLILMSFHTQSYLPLLIIIPLTGSMLIQQQTNTLVIYLLSTILIAADVAIENIFNLKIYISPLYLPLAIAFILTYYLRLTGQKARHAIILKEDSQKKLAETNKQLLEIEHQGKEFTGLAAQQIFTPLATIQSFVQTIQSETDGKLSIRQKQFVNETSNYIEKMHHMLKELLFISKIEFSGYTLNYIPTDLTEIIRKAIIKYEPVLKAKNIEIIYKFPNDIPTIKADEGNLLEIFTRLIDNSIRYSPTPSQITLSIQVIQKEDGPHLLVEILDHGYGIPLEEQKYLFRKFFRGTNILPLDSFGNGLSLFIVKLIADKHNAGIKIKTAVNQGTSVQLDFKLSANPSLQELRQKIPAANIKSNIKNKASALEPTPMDKVEKNLDPTSGSASVTSDKL